MDANPLPIRARDRTPEEGPQLAAPLPLTVVLDNVRSAFNVGSVFRTAEAARIRELLLCGITPYPPNEKLDRTALGTVHRVAWRHYLSGREALSALRAEGARIWACELCEGAVSLRDARFTRPAAVVFGHEVAGVSPAILAAADEVIEIPLFGRKNSLNVATAAGIVIFEVLRQWGH